MKSKIIILIVIVCYQFFDGMSQTIKCPNNIDFENGNFNGWNLSSGTCCPINTPTSGSVNGRHTITSGTGTDPYGNFPIVPQGGGNYALKLGNASTGAQAEKARYRVRVPSGVSNYSLIYRYAVVFQDPQHSKAQQPRFEVKAYDSITNTVIKCANFSYIASSNIPGFKQSGSGSAVYYKAWSTASINLSGYAGRTIIIEFASGDCSQGGHFGYGYVDLSCGLFQISSVACKGQTTSALSAPPGFQSYDWRDSSMGVQIGTTATININTPKKRTKYFVILKPYDGFGCPDTLTTVIEVTEIKALFSISDSTQCQRDNKFQFVNSSTVSHGDLTYYWDYGDASVANIKAQDKTYLSDGSYDITLIVTADDGCADTTAKRVIVHEQPHASYTLNDSAQCMLNNLFAFTNNSNLAKDTLFYLWDFGNGDSSNMVNPVYHYNLANNHLTSLVARSEKNCLDTFFKPVEVYPQPEAYFTVDDSTQCLRDNLFRFTNKSSMEAGNLSYTWYYGNGISSNLIHPAYTYQNDGSNNISLIANSTYSCSDTFNKPVEVYPQPKSDFNINNLGQCLRNNRFVFTDNSTIAYGILAFRWSFDNGDTDSVKDPVYSYKVNKVYHVGLIVSSEQNCRDSVEKQVEVFPQPLADFTISDSTQCLLDNLFQFTNNSKMDYGSYSSNWFFGDTSASTNLNASHSYHMYGTFKVNLIIHSENNCNDTFSKSIDVYPQPIANFTVNDSTQCIRDNRFQFADQSWIDTGSLAYRWFFGDGDSSTLKQPLHSYLPHQMNSVRLISSSVFNCRDTFYKSVMIYPQADALFEVNDSNQCLRDNRFVFTDKSKIAEGTLDYNWSFGKSDFSNIANPVYVYTTHNLYQVRLVVSSIYGCNDTAYNSLEVFPQPSADFAVNDSTQCLFNNSFDLTGKSKIASGSLDFIWHFGDGNSSSAMNTVWNYQSHGNYMTSLIASSAFNCSDTAYKAIEVYPQGSLDFTADTVCLNNRTTINSISTLPTGDFKSYEWEFGDYLTSSGNQVEHLYAKPGYYSIRLKTMTDHGCMDNILKNNFVYVRELPSAAFTYTKELDSFPVNGFQFNDASSHTSGLNYSWTFDGYGSSWIQNPYFEFYDTGKMNVSLSVKDAFGCSENFSKSVEVAHDFKLFLPNAFTNNGDNTNENYNPVGMPYVKHYKMEIYNTWGNLLFTSYDIQKGWDGTHNGLACTQGIYVCLVKVTTMEGNIKTYKASIVMLK